jgi:hypothetical protein
MHLGRPETLPTYPITRSVGTAGWCLKSAGYMKGEKRGEKGDREKGDRKP